MPGRPYPPAQLPEIDEVEIIALYGEWPEHREYMAATTSRPAVCVGGADAQAIASTFRALPQGKQARCHMPPYCVRFYAGGALLFGASICGECDNIYGADVQGALMIEFDARSTGGRRLFKLLGAATKSLPPPPIPPPPGFEPSR
jgi:hypothetical protein